MNVSLFFAKIALMEIACPFQLVALKQHSDASFDT